MFQPLLYSETIYNLYSQINGGNKIFEGVRDFPRKVYSTTNISKPFPIWLIKSVYQNYHVAYTLTIDSRQEFWFQV